MSSIRNKTVLITGGAAGIGKIMGELCLQEGAKELIIWDIDHTAMQKVAEDLTGKGYRVHTYPVDVSRLEQVTQAAAAVKQNQGEIDILINNAGVIIGKQFWEHTHRDIDFTMRINTDAFMHIALEFLPGMISRGSGHLVNIASAAGMTANPKMSVYVASKWAVIGWSESLRLELEAVSKNLRVTTVTPFYINTGMFEGVRSPIVPILDPNKAARKIIAGIKQNKIFVRMPGIVYILPFVKGILPQRWADTVIGKWFGIYKSMDHFKGKHQ
ncbi:MAG: SDR family oxidoreductase [Lacibacter sp.]|jgi:short-subunit dehydrogenase